MEEFLRQNGIDFERDVPLSNKTWIKTGGICDYWVTPETVEQLEALCRYLYAESIAFKVVGQTSNIFFHSNYYAPIIVSTVKVNQYSITDGIATCDCGVLVVNLAKDALKHGYAGFYGLVGLPGTVASSVYGNAGCFQCSIATMLLSADLLMPNGVIKNISKEQLGYTFRSSVLKRKELEGVILSVRLQLERASDVQEELRKAEETIRYRKTKQEAPEHCLGSVFSQLKPRRNVRNAVAFAWSVILGKLGLCEQKKAYKNCLLNFYGYSDLKQYVSDKNINTFVWSDDGAEEKFERYKRFMTRMNKNTIIEIEELVDSRKKVGILTYHRAENYGALLQAYALRSYIQRLGYEVSFVDYWPKYHVEHFRIFSFDKFKKRNMIGKIKYLLFFVLWGVPKWVRKQRLQRFMHERLYLGNQIKYQNDSDYTEPYDVVVYGSDQIWRRQGIHNNEFNPWYFGSPNVVAKKKVTYAASMGVIDTNEHDDKQIKAWLMQFDALSVREQDVKDYIDKLGSQSLLVSDPVLLRSKEEWRELYKPVKKGGYILFYNLLDSVESVRFAKALSRMTHLPIKEINMVPSIKGYVSRGYVACASVERFLQLFDGAEYVVSNSFHGVAFSLVYEKQFWAVGFGKMKGRAVSLLDSAGIPERFCTTAFTPSMLSQTIHYVSVRENLNRLIENSKMFLNDTLQ